MCACTGGSICRVGVETRTRDSLRLRSLLRRRRPEPQGISIPSGSHAHVCWVSLAPTWATGPTGRAHSLCRSGNRWYHLAAVIERVSVDARRRGMGIAITALVMAAILAVLGQYAWAGDGYLADDAFISFRYAANLAEGLGPNWNRGDHVEGYTNFGWVLLLALGQKLGAEPVETSRTLGFLGSAATLALMPLLAAQLRPMWSARWGLLTAGAVTALALNTGFSLWAFAGLETTAFTFLVTAGITAHLSEERRDVKSLWSSAIFLAAALVRPEGVVVWAVSAVFKLLRILSGGSQKRLSDLALWVVLFVVPYGGYWMWRWDYYGYFFPNTYYLKTARSLAVFKRGAVYAQDFFTIYWVWLGLGALISAWRERHISYRPATYLLAMLGVWSAEVVYTGGDWMPYFRFFVPVLPIVYLLMMHGAIDVADLLRLRVPIPAFTVVASALLVALIVFSAFRPHDDCLARSGRFDSNSGDSCEILPGAVDYANQKAIGLWMRDNLPSNYTVAQIATGIVPYFSGLTTIDMLGVNDEHIAHLNKPSLGLGPAGHEKEDGGYVVSREPEIIWLALNIEGKPRQVVDDYLPPKDIDWVPVKTSVTRNGYVWFLYRPVAIPLQGGWLNVLVHNRVDTARFEGTASDEELRDAIGAPLR